MSGERPGRTDARAYFALQGAAGALWWVLVMAVPAVRELTLSGLDPVLVAIADVPLFVGGSLLAACGVRWAAHVTTVWTALVAAGMALYATVTTLAGWGAFLMIAAAGFSVLASLVMMLGRLPTEWIVTGPFRFREAPAHPRLSHGANTALQIVIFWAILLGLVPAIITLIEQRWQLHVEIPTAVRIIAAVLFVAFASLGIRSAHLMVQLGRGTPLPRYTAPVLVIAGPYRWVRNPMAVAGIGQGVMVGVMMSSWLVVLYALIGASIWNWAVRPSEEADLEARFGTQFAAYRDSVTCWIPRIPRA